jgi:hypothetical protein
MQSLFVLRTLTKLQELNKLRRPDDVALAHVTNLRILTLGYFEVAASRLCSAALVAIRSDVLAVGVQLCSTS